MSSLPQLKNYGVNEAVTSDMVRVNSNVIIDLLCEIFFNLTGRSWIRESLISISIQKSVPTLAAAQKLTWWEPKWAVTNLLNYFLPPPLQLIVSSPDSAILVVVGGVLAESKRLRRGGGERDTNTEMHFLFQLKYVNVDFSLTSKMYTILFWPIT